MTFYELLWYFSIYSFLGWCMEVVFCTVRTGKLVNRGFLNGPVCPIYGFGMVIVLAVLGRFSDNIALLFFGGMVLTSALELVGGAAAPQQRRAFRRAWPAGAARGRTPCGAARRAARARGGHAGGA